jgi:acetoin:2,6-dichlorophenolindophenol oxidoreductase subunit alpha
MRKLTRNQQAEMFRRMVTIRRFEEEVKRLYRAGEITGAIHLYIGQEAIAVGISATLRDDDYVFSTHRGHGHLIAKGGDLKRMMAELMGKATGCSHGCGGSMHMFDPAVGFMGGNGIVGGGIPLALGAAFSAQYRGVKSVAVAYFGDGGMYQGVLHESLNLAAKWSLPFIAVCENNRYAATTPVAKAAASQDFAAYAAPHGIPGVHVDGNDCLAVYEAARQAVDRARAGQGPTLLDCDTYRVEPHCGIIADDRPPGEREEWARTDTEPIERLGRRLNYSKKQIDHIRVAIDRELAAAVEFARQSPLPDVRAFFQERIV